MDETKIAAQVAQNIPKDEPSVQKPEIAPEDVGENIADHTHLDYEDPILHQRLNDYFEVPRMAKFTEETHKQLKTVLDWADQMTGTGEVADILLIINRIERELGSLNKTNRLARVYRFIKVQQQSVMLDKEMELLKNG